MELPPRPDDWYHCIDLPQGRTPGFFDLTAADRAMPWPDLTGKRCLDVATYDGYWAFEMERRGAAEVVAVDLADKSEIDYVPRRRDRVMEGPTGTGFMHASAALGSAVDRSIGSVYTLDPEVVGTFDFVFMGSLLAHLRSPMTALERVRSVCSGTFVSMEPVDLLTSTLVPRRPVLALVPGFDWVWGTPNLAGHRIMLDMAGFDIEAQVTTLLEYTSAVTDRVRGVRGAVRRLAMRSLGLGAEGLPASIVIGRPGASLGSNLPIARRAYG